MIDMRINNNIGALNAQKNQNANNNAVANKLEKLSSGKQINRAADNAAGLAISEKMRTQILGAMTASRNTQDAVSLIQVAEGGLSSMQGMLQRQRELALQSANGTNDDKVDRPALQGEFENIVAELDSTATTTQFNGMNVLDGTNNPITIQAGPNAEDTVNIEIGAMTASELLNFAGEDYNAATDANIASAGAASSSLYNNRQRNQRYIDAAGRIGSATKPFGIQNASSRHSGRKHKSSRKPHTRHRHGKNDVRTDRQKHPSKSVDRNARPGKRQTAKHSRNVRLS